MELIFALFNVFYVMKRMKYQFIQFHNILYLPHKLHRCIHHINKVTFIVSPIIYILPMANIDRFTTSYTQLSHEWNSTVRMNELSCHAYSNLSLTWSTCVLNYLPLIQYIAILKKNENKCSV